MSVRISCAHRCLAHLLLFLSPRLGLQSQVAAAAACSFDAFPCNSPFADMSVPRMASTTIGKVMNAQHRNTTTTFDGTSHSCTCICKYRIARPPGAVLCCAATVTHTPPSIWVACR
ncbi:hypothetical protein J3F84DRAFT_384303 [Trichoderma pleuroticola]